MMRFVFVYCLSSSLEPLLFDRKLGHLVFPLLLSCGEASERRRIVAKIFPSPLRLTSQQKFRRKNRGRQEPRPLEFAARVCDNVT